MPHARPAGVREGAPNAITADPLGDTVTAVVSWAGAVPEPAVAATAIGLPVTADVTRVLGTVHVEALAA